MSKPENIKRVWVESWVQLISGDLLLMMIRLKQTPLKGAEPILSSEFARNAQKTLWLTNSNLWFGGWKSPWALFGREISPVAQKMTVTYFNYKKLQVAMHHCFMLILKANSLLFGDPDNPPQVV